MGGRRLALLVLPLAAAAGACATLSFDGGVGSPTPSLTSTPTPTATPSATPLDVGDGSDGSLSVPNNTTVNPTTCSRVSSASGSTIGIADPSIAPAGARLLLMQVQGYASMVGSTAAIADPGSAGRWEIATVANASIPGAVSTVAPLVNAYVTSGVARAQACRMPQYRDVNVNGLLGAVAWNGTSGGVVAFFASGSLSVTGATAILDGGGLPAGAVHVGNNGNSGTTALNTSPDDGGPKGMGIDPDAVGRYGRGNYANGGGGGNAEQAGGGGGGNGGMGGFGGKQYQVIGDTPLTAGLPGAALAPADASRIFFGGGGGAGHSEFGQCPGGGLGGGVILVSAAKAKGTSKIRAAGKSVGTGQSDGCGGGGAGGTIVFSVQDASLYTGILDATGGDGAQMGGVVGPPHFGPGGGGGGGRIELLGTSLPAAQLTVAGGASGTNADGNAWGATPGASGVVFP